MRNPEKIYKNVKKIIYEDGTEINIRYDTTYFLLVESKVIKSENFVEFNNSYNYSKLLSKTFTNELFMNSIIFKLMIDFNITYDEAFAKYKKEMESIRLKQKTMKKFGCKDD